MAVISQGINAGDLKKLQDAGIFTCNGLMMQTKKVCTTQVSILDHYVAASFRCIDLPLSLVTSPYLFCPVLIVAPSSERIITTLPWQNVAHCESGLFVQSLCNIKGLSEAKVEKICEAAEKVVVSTLDRSPIPGSSWSTWCSSELWLDPVLWVILFTTTDKLSIGIPALTDLFCWQNLGYVTGNEYLHKVRL